MVATRRKTKKQCLHQLRSAKPLWMFKLSREKKQNQVMRVNQIESRIDFDLDRLKRQRKVALVGFNLFRSISYSENDWKTLERQFTQQNSEQNIGRLEHVKYWFDGQIFCSPNWYTIGAKDVGYSIESSELWKVYCK